MPGEIEIGSLLSRLRTREQQGRARKWVRMPIARHSPGRARLAESRAVNAVRPPKSRRLPPISASTASGGARAMAGVNCVAHEATASSAADSASGSRSRNTRSGESASDAETSCPGCTPASRAAALAPTMRGVRPPVVTANGFAASAGERPRAKTSSGQRGQEEAGPEHGGAWRSASGVDSSSGRLAPDGRLRKPELGELGRAQVRLVRAEEFVELRRLDRRCRRASRAPGPDDGFDAGTDARGGASRSRSRCPRAASPAPGPASMASVSVPHAATRRRSTARCSGASSRACRAGLFRLEEAIDVAIGRLAVGTPVPARRRNTSRR